MNTHLYEEVLDSISDALITVDQDRNIINWNKRAEAFFGYSKEEMQRLGLDVIIPPVHRERHAEGYRRFVESIHSRTSYVSEAKEVEGLRRSGETFPVEITHSLLKISDERYYITAIIRDVTARKRYELMRDRLERVTRHDLKNKIVIVGLAAKRLVAALNLPPEDALSRYLAILAQECREMLDMLDSTRELILLETGDYKPRAETFDLVEVLSAKAEQMKTLGDVRGVEIRLRNFVRRSPVSIHADRSLLERAIENLLKNAVEAENAPGVVEATLSEDGEGSLRIEIHNGGKCIPEELRDSLFQPYVTHGKKDGTGLGLYSAKLALEKVHGWKLSFDSSQERGTTFVIELGKAHID